MCGICGQFHYREKKSVDRQTIERMTRALVHRGPDDEGYYFAGPLGLGFRRLSIIDLEGGHQPMSDAEQSVWVVFNGEIYNFPELRQELEGYGHTFRTRSDTEVILHGYKQWGEEVFAHLNGMYGLAIWDERNEKLLLSRDPMGIKPVYYKIEEDDLYFASEIKAIMAATGEMPDVDPASLNLFFRYRYTPAPFTLYRGVRKLAPGTMLICEKGKISIKRWYAYEPVPFSPMKTAGEAKEELLEIYKRAVKRHLISDVPVGLLLSGGVDSGLLLGLMSLYGNSWPTYTVGYGKSFRNDELEDAAKTAEVYSSRHTGVVIDRETFETELPRMVSMVEEPVATSSIVPMYFVSQRARQDVKVALFGQGPDELFGGYRRHLGVYYGSLWRGLPPVLRKAMAGLVDRLPRNETLKRGVHSLDEQDRMKRYQQVFSILPGGTVDSLFREGVLPPDTGDRILQCWSGLEQLLEHTDELGGFQYLEMRSAQPDELLMYADKLSMAHGLEVRVPYLDREIVEYAERLSASLKVRYGRGKWLHRQVCRDFLPEPILRRKKRGFATDVVDQWFQSSSSGKMEGMLMDSSSLLYRYLQPSKVQQLLHEHRVGKNDHYKTLFSLIFFEEWLRVNGSGN
jgi:asparagine synthase (glutamine-hydrolysing)